MDVMPTMRYTGVSLMFSRRLNEKTTSFAVIWSPFENLTPLRIVKVNVRAFFETLYDVAREGTGLLYLPPRNVTRVSYMAWKTGVAVKSTPPRAGSPSLLVKEKALSTTIDPDGAFAVLFEALLACVVAFPVQPARTAADITPATA